MSSIERQRHQRYPTSEKAHVEVYGQSIQAEAYLRNLSQGGAFLEWNANLPPVSKGDILRLTVELSQVGKKHKVSAEVVWIKEDATHAGIGISFIRPEDVVTKLMSRY
ncbi:MAG: PilZ domain-containing protein [Pseudobdellovibrionaceae bacterium]